MSGVKASPVRGACAAPRHAARSARPGAWSLAALLASLAALFPATTSAESRALLVGVGRYQYPGIDLPAIDLDLERVREMLNRIGFDDRQIRTLQDEQATSVAVVHEMSTWLREGVGPQDHVVLYFSGHGSNVPDFDGDETDGADEVLVTHDMRRVTRNGRSTLSGVVTDDQIATLLSRIRSQNVLVIVDACHSGTVTRSFDLENHSLARGPVYPKAFIYPGMPESRQSGFTRDLAVRPEQNFASLTAAADGEKAIGTLSGGVFTTGLTQAVATAAEKHEPVTLLQLRDQTRAYIRAKVDPREVHTPQLTGSPELASQPLSFGSGPTAKPTRQRLLALAQARTRKFELRASGGASHAVDEPVTLEMKLPEAGYLNVVSVDADDRATVLFPNRLHADNRVGAGAFRFPTADMKFDLLASEPTGPNLVVAFLTPSPLDFYAATIEDRDAAGVIKVDFAALSNDATRALRTAADASLAWVAQLEMQIVPKRPAKGGAGK